MASSSDTPPERPYRLVVEYDGGAYAGWQRQTNAPSVQQAIEEALERVVRHPVRCDGSGRTDAGVHALGQVARVRIAAPNVTAEDLRRGTNTYLPDDVRIVSAELCDATFDPRRDARMRWYRYTIAHQATAPALDRRRVVHIPHPMDWQAVEQALQFLEGDHDFRAFRSSACTATRTRLTLVAAQHVDEHPRHHLDFRCRSFLHNMVRLMAGLMIEVGQGRHSPEVVSDLLNSGERSVRFRTAPPHGLVLMHVGYADAE